MSNNTFTPEQQALLEQLGISNIPVPHLQAFFNQAEALGLDPRRKEMITIIERKSKNHGSTYTVQVGIAGYRKAARDIVNANGETLEIDDWLFAGQDREWTECWDFSIDGFPAFAKAVVKRNGQKFSKVIAWSEFVQMYNGTPQALWKTKPSYMLGKTAESICLRVAFPDELGGTLGEGEFIDTHGVEEVEKPKARPRRKAKVDAPAVEEPKQITSDPAEMSDEALAIYTAICKAETKDAVRAEYRKAAKLDDEVEAESLKSLAGERAMEVED